MSTDFDISGLLDQTNSLPIQSEGQNVTPEEDTFHSIYIAGQERENESGVVEKVGLFQIRGFDYNRTEIYMVITHIKNMLVKVEFNEDTNRDVLSCFCYQVGPLPHKGTSGNICPENALKRASVPFCKNCRCHLVVAGILTDDKGKPLQGKDGKIVFGFIRGKGVKYGYILDYISLLSNTEFDSYILGKTNTDKERKIISSKRVVTKITASKTDTKYGKKDIFKLESVVKLSDDTVRKILDVSIKSIDMFNEKFDWSRRQQQSQSEISKESEPAPSNQFPWDEPESNAKQESENLDFEM